MKGDMHVARNRAHKVAALSFLLMNTIDFYKNSAVIKRSNYS